MDCKKQFHLVRTSETRNKWGRAAFVEISNLRTQIQIRCIAVLRRWSSCKDQISCDTLRDRNKTGAAYVRHWIGRDCRLFGNQHCSWWQQTYHTTIAKICGESHYWNGGFEKVASRVRCDIGEDLATLSEKAADEDFIYQKLIDSFLLLYRNTRLEVILAESMLARYVGKLLIMHAKAVLRLVLYLSGTRNYGLSLKQEWTTRFLDALKMWAVYTSVLGVHWYRFRVITVFYASQ